MSVKPLSVKTKPAPASADRSEPNLTLPFDDEKTQPVSMELIARLVAQDPAVRLEIGLPEPGDASSPEEQEKQRKTGQ